VPLPMCVSPTVGAVHAGVGLNFDIVFKNGGAGLDDFVPGAVFAFGETEAVGPDDGAVLENDAIPMRQNSRTTECDVRRNRRRFARRGRWKQRCEARRSCR